jgi:hypothetical protein
MMNMVAGNSPELLKILKNMDSTDNFRMPGALELIM